MLHVWVIMIFYRTCRGQNYATMIIHIIHISFLSLLKDGDIKKSGRYIFKSIFCILQKYCKHATILFIRISSCRNLTLFYRFVWLIYSVFCNLFLFYFCQWTSFICKISFWLFCFLKATRISRRVCSMLSSKLAWLTFDTSVSDKVGWWI